jgi:hypothetical protein
MVQRMRASGLRIKEFVFSSQSVGRLALTLYRLLRDRQLDLPDDGPLLDELAQVRLIESNPGQYRLDHAADGHDDMTISLALAAYALVERGQPAQATTSSPARLRMPSPAIARRGGDASLGDRSAGRSATGDHKEWSPGERGLDRMPGRTDERHSHGP